MSTLVREGLEAKLSNLESLRVQTMGSPPGEEPQACASCYVLMEECVCLEPVEWPLNVVVYKLRAELAHGAP